MVKQTSNSIHQRVLINFFFRHPEQLNVLFLYSIESLSNVSLLKLKRKVDFIFLKNP